MPEPLLTASAMFANAARFSDAYHAALSPLCAETGLPPAAAGPSVSRSANRLRDGGGDLPDARTEARDRVVSY